MPVLLRIVVGVILIAHGLVHLLYLAKDVPEFTLEDSWLVPESATSWLAPVLMWATVAAFVFLGLAVWGVPGLAGSWPAIAIAGSTLSLLLLVAYWNWALVFGVLIDVALIAIAVIRPGWTDEIGA